MKRTFFGVGAAAALSLAGLGAYAWSPLPGLDREALAAPAAAYDGEILRDEWGVPHVYGRRDADAVFAYAYANAEDEFELVQESVAAARGVLGRYRGSGAAQTDYLVELLGVWDLVDARYETDLSDDVKAVAEAFATGVNLYAARHPDKAWPGLFPVTAKDVVAGFVFRTPFFYGMDADLIALFGDERALEVALDPAEDRAAYEIAPRTLAERGSNAFAVAPGRSADGKTRLIVNSHQPYAGPVAWYEAHIRSDETLDIMGSTFPGSPLILHGWNRNLGWANTVNQPDLVDIYVLEVNPEDPGQYRLDGEWVDFQTRRTDFRVKLFGPFAWPVRRKILRSVHGPVVQSDHGTYAIRYAGRNEVRQLEQYYRLNTADSLDAFKAAMAMQALPSINYVYADRDGNIGYVSNGLYPERAEGWDWRKYLPGDRSDLIWDAYKPFSAVPQLFNPQSGLIFNSNNDPMFATDGPDNLRPEDFSPTMGLQTNETNRSLRIRELTDGETPLSEAALLEIKFDTAYSSQSEAARIVAEILEMDWSGDPALEAAAAHLAEWNFKTEASNRYAALGVLSVVKAITARFTGITPPEPADAFREAVALLEANYGRIDPAWGEVNRLVRGAADLPLAGAPDTLRAVYPAEVRDDGHLHGAAGDTFIAVVEWDAEGAVSAKTVHQFGSATLDEGSPHYADQTQLFAMQRFKRALFNWPDVEAGAVERYRPGEARD